jgi:hypothetical protein
LKDEYRRQLDAKLIERGLPVLTDKEVVDLNILLLVGGNIELREEDYWNYILDKIGELRSPEEATPSPVDDYQRVGAAMLPKTRRQLNQKLLDKDELELSSWEIHTLDHRMMNLNRPDMKDSEVSIIGWYLANISQLRMLERNIEDAFTYHPPKAGQPAAYETIRANAKDMAYVILSNTPSGIEQDEAIKNLRQVVMWANAAVATL